MLNFVGIPHSDDTGDGYALGCLAAAFHFDLPVIVAMRAVRVVQVISDKIIHMVAMRDALVPAVRAMAVPAIMLIACVFWRAAVRIPAADLYCHTVVVISVACVHVPIMEVSDIIAAPDRGVSAICIVDVIMLLVTILAVHTGPPHYGM